MEWYRFSNEEIDIACEKAGKFLASAGVDRREALRIKLTLEEVLLDYQAKFGTEAQCRLKLVKRLSSVKIELTVQGESYDPFDKGEEDEGLINRLLSRIGLAPSWNYRNGRNSIVFI